MSEKDIIFEGKVKQTDIFDFKELYTFLFQWLVDEGYKLDEKKYSEKATANGKELEIEWEAKKKVSDYFRFIIKSTWRILGMTSVEVEIPNSKKTKKMDKGQFEIKVGAILEKDYEHRWEGNAFSKFLRGIYDRYIVRARVEGYEKRLFTEADEFLAQIKSFLALQGRH